MNSNFIKSYYKANGIIATLIAAVALVGLGFLSGGDTNLNLASLLGAAPEVNTLTLGIVSGLLLAGCLLGFTGLKNSKSGFLDFIRLTGFISSVELAIIYLLNFFNLTETNHFYTFAFLGFALIYLIQLIVRFVFVNEDEDGQSIKNYFGALTGKYNPFLILLCGIVIAGGVYAYAKFTGDLSIQFFDYLIQNDFIIYGTLAALGVLALISLADKSNEANFIDFILSVIAVAGTILVVLSSIKGLFPTAQVEVINYVLIVLASVVTLIFVRAVSYSNGAAYTNPSQKIRTYFRSTYNKYDVVLTSLLVLVSALALALALTGALGTTGTIFYTLGTSINANFFSTSSFFYYILIFGVIGIAAILFLLLLIYNKFNSANVVRTDKLLLPLISVSLLGVIAGVVGIIEGIADETLKLFFIVLLSASGAFFVFAFIVQLIRFKNYNPIESLIAQSIAQKAEEEKAKQEAEEAEAEEEVELEETEKADPFGLTAEDEEIYNSIYGEKTEEPQEEQVEYVEEEVQEEPAEEVEYVEEEVAEEPTEEVVYVEEAQEEPTEEVEYVEEEVTDEEADDAEDEAEEAEDLEAEADETEEVEYVEEEVEAPKENNIVLQQFEVLDADGQPKKIKRRFISKMMYAEPETKEYYNEIKNYLEMYRAKGRQSARCETFRYKGLVAKVALGGKAVKVALAIDPSFIEENPKYHLKDVSEKKQYRDVPVMIRVRSDRGLKYFKELVDYMMANRGVKPKKNFEATNYLPQLIPNGEAILGAMGMSNDYMQPTMNQKGVPAELPDNLDEFIPQFPAEPLEEDEIEASVYLDTLCNHFEDNQEVTIDILKSLHIVNRGNVIRIKARGTLDRRLIIYAEYFDEDALKMILCTNGTAIKIVR